MSLQGADSRSVVAGPLPEGLVLVHVEMPGQKAKRMRTAGSVAQSVLDTYRKQQVSTTGARRASVLTGKVSLVSGMLATSGDVRAAGDPEQPQAEAPAPMASDHGASNRVRRRGRCPPPSRASRLCPQQQTASPASPSALASLADQDARGRRGSLQVAPSKIIPGLVLLDELPAGGLAQARMRALWSGAEVDVAVLRHLGPSTAGAEALQSVLDPVLRSVGIHPHLARPFRYACSPVSSHPVIHRAVLEGVPAGAAPELLSVEGGTVYLSYVTPAAAAEGLTVAGSMTEHSGRMWSERASQSGVALGSSQATAPSKQSSGTFKPSAGNPTSVFRSVLGESRTSRTFPAEQRLMW